MSPEYGATAALFPVDDETLRYLRVTGRDEALVDLVERYTKAQGLFRTDATPDPEFSERLEIDLARSSRASRDRAAAGPHVAERRAEDPARRVSAKQFVAAGTPSESGQRSTSGNGSAAELAATAGSVVIAAITSCTNTSNPSVMVSAGLLAKKAVERGLTTKPYVKTSLAPGSRVVTRLPERRRPAARARGAQVQRRRLRLHHVHRRGHARAPRERHRAPDRAAAGCRRRGGSRSDSG